jgi:hypothetical protein
MKIVHPGSNRVGSFNILNEVLRDDAPMCAALFALCTLLASEDHESGRGKTYIAASALFEPLAEGEEIPEYRIEFARDCPLPNPEWEAKRVNSGAFGFAAFRKIIVRAPPAQLAARPHQTRLH